MTGGRLESLLRRDRAVVVAALVLIAGLAWFSLIRLGAAHEMGPAFSATGRAMPDMAIAADGGSGPAFAPWSASDVLLMFAMWAVMMVGMMTPSIAPTILLYARVGRQAESRGAPFAATGWFASGYLLAWTGFAALATLLQWALEQAALLTPAMASASPLFGGALLIVAGLYQWSPLKHACLSQCQAPFLFIQRHGGFRRRPGAAAALGMRHAAYCIGCCWGLMILLFLGGVMNLLWIAALAALVLAEKLIARGAIVSRLSGTAFLAAGGAMWLGAWAPVPF